MDAGKYSRTRKLRNMLNEGEAVRHYTVQLLAAFICIWSTNNVTSLGISRSSGKLFVLSSVLASRDYRELRLRFPVWPPGNGGQEDADCLFFMWQPRCSVSFAFGPPDFLRPDEDDGAKRISPRLPALTQTRPVESDSGSRLSPLVRHSAELEALEREGCRLSERERGRCVAESGGGKWTTSRAAGRAEWSGVEISLSSSHPSMDCRERHNCTSQCKHTRANM